MQKDPYSSPHTKLKFKWAKDFNINPVKLNLIKEKAENNLELISKGDGSEQNTTTTGNEINN